MPEPAAFSTNLRQQNHKIKHHDQFLVRWDYFHLNQSTNELKKDINSEVNQHHRHLRYKSINDQFGFPCHLLLRNEKLANNFSACSPYFAHHSRGLIGRMTQISNEKLKVVLARIFLLTQESSPWRPLFSRRLFAWGSSRAPQSGR